MTFVKSELRVIIIEKDLYTVDFLKILLLNILNYLEKYFCGYRKV